MNKNLFAFGFLGLVLGTALGGALSRKDAKGERLAGELSACSDIALGINGLLPIGMACKELNGQIVLYTALQPNEFYSLKGKKISD